MSVSASASDSAAPAGGGGSGLDELLDNERTNFRLLYDAVGELGAVPAMLRSVDMSATIPDEKVNVCSVLVGRLSTKALLHSDSLTSKFV